MLFYGCDGRVVSVADSCWENRWFESPLKLEFVSLAHTTVLSPLSWRWGVWEEHIGLPYRMAGSRHVVSHSLVPPGLTWVDWRSVGPI